VPDEIIPGGQPSALGNTNVRTKKGHQGQEHGFSKGKTKVRVIVPPATGAKPIAKSWDPHFDAASGGGSSKRKIMNLAFVEASDNSNTRYVTSFDPPIELRVAVTSDDTQHQPDKTKLTVGYCRKGGAWTPFGDITLSDAQDELVVSISTWYDDPGIGVW
jgi:hypothetical protein